MLTRLRMIRICLIISMVFALSAGCSDDVASNKGPNLDVDLDYIDTNRPDPSDTGPRTDVKTDPDLDAEKSDITSDVTANTDTNPNPSDTKYEVCLLGNNQPTSQDCLSGDELDFGWIPVQSQANQHVRLTNTGTTSFWISGLDVTNSGTTDALLDTLAFSLTPDPDNPAQSIQEPQTVPTRLLPGESLLIKVSITAGTISGTLQTEAVVLDLDLGEIEPTVIAIPLIAEIGDCEAGTLSCDGLASTGCETNTHDDPTNCGSCGFVCDLDNVDSICADGICQMDGQCVAGFDNCDKDHANGCETSITTDDENCGACGTSCLRTNADGTCNGSAKCEIICHDNFDDCNGDLFGNDSDGCEVFLPESVDHCGACGNKCELANASPTCTDSACAIDACDAGYDNCDGNPANGCEIHTETNVNHCGTCDNKCVLPNAIAKCTDGGCEIESCHTGFADCDGDPTNGCEINLANNVDNCGACGTVCEFDSSSAICDDKVCKPSACAAGFGDCDGNPANGCEANLKTDADNCSVCGFVCELDNASSDCSAGSCTINTCATDYDNCDSRNTTGCETHLPTDANHCGACGQKCNLPNAIAKCSEGGCEVESCHEGWSDCDGDPTNGCEVNLNSLNNCGACGNTCDLDNATASCTNQECIVKTCDSGFSNCNGEHEDGCETNLNEDDNNCGTCNKVCSFPNAGSVCSTGECEIVSCVPGYGDCTAAPGCESYLPTDVNNCGSCGTTCSFPNAAPVCSNGSCDIGTCLGDFRNCDGQLANGCETSIKSDVNHCGGCGLACDLPNANPICTDGGCRIGTCHDGFADCDGDPSNGCEVNLNADGNNCGTCGNICDLADASATCNNGSCQVDTCDPGFANCDQKHPNGCEIDTYTDNQNCGGCGTTCAISNAVAQCQEPGTCAFVGCLPGFIDLNNNLSDGCEYQCTPSAGEDRPQDVTISGYYWLNHDKNCDGIDGDASRALFVATDGDDSYPGTRALPLRTIQTAINRIANTSTTLDQVYVSVGNYKEQITLRSGISIYGGFSRDENWRRSPSYITTIENVSPLDNGNIITVKGENISSALLQNVTIRAGGATSYITGTNHGASSYGVHCRSCTGLALVGNKIYPGTGGTAKAADPNTSTRPKGGNGGNGGNGSPDGSAQGARGSAGTSSCGGYRGGLGGLGGEEGKHNGENGYSGHVVNGGGGKGGNGGGGGNPGAQGDPGQTNGAPGTTGTPGVGASNDGSLIGYFWQGRIGSIGGIGTPGHGGGGGGGGGGQGCTFCNNGAGNGGGGGGAGGCGGYGGYGGYSGGGSFGIFLINSTNALITNNTVTTVRGGNGGNGGMGSVGSDGGEGGEGGDAEKPKEILPGGKGSSGGKGGQGGYGGGGAGGPSIPVVTSNSSIQGNVETANTLIPGTGGNGGAGGQTGTSGFAKKHHAL